MMPRLILLPMIAISAVLLAQLPSLSQMGLSALPLAILLGMVVGHISCEGVAEFNHKVTLFCQKYCLRFGIILFGLNLSFQQIANVGFETLLLNVIVICTVIAAGLWLGIKVLKLPADTAILISAGSAICGAAAVLATDSAIKARQQQVTIAVATVVLFGTLAMFSYPVIFPHSLMSEQAFGIYIGSTVHEVAQAVAAGQSISPEALDNAVVTKLIRVMLLAPFILILSTYMTRKSEPEMQVNTFAIMPWFILGFILMAGVNSIFEVPENILQGTSYFSQFLLALAMAALGIQTRLALLKEAGIKPIIMALCLFVLLLAGGLFLNLLIV